MTSPEEWVPEEVELKNIDSIKLNHSKRRVNAIEKYVDQTNYFMMI